MVQRAQGEGCTREGWVLEEALREESCQMNMNSLLEFTETNTISHPEQFFGNVDPGRIARKLSCPFFGKLVMTWNKTDHEPCVSELPHLQSTVKTRCVVNDIPDLYMNIPRNSFQQYSILSTSSTQYPIHFTYLLVTELLSTRGKGFHFTNWKRGSGSQC